MNKKHVFLGALTCFTVLFMIQVLNLFQVSVFASDFIKMVNILSSESASNPIFQKGLSFAKTIFLLFIFSNIILIFASIFLFKQFNTKKNESFIDPMCKTYNKRYLEKFNKKCKNLDNFSVMMIDIDFFKKYNDNYGHLKGDEVISTIASLLTDNCRKSDKIIRYGGEEFCILLPNTNNEEAIILANRLLQKVDESKIEHLYSPISKYLTLSIGISSTATRCSNKHDLSELLHLADAELYKAKSNGRSQYSCI